MSKTKLTLLTALLLLMVVSLTVLVPSGAVTDEALSRYEDALWEEDEETDESARNLLLYPNKSFAKTRCKARKNP